MWQKILLALQVWNLSAISGQIMRAAGCILFEKVASATFSKVSEPDRRYLSGSICAYREMNWMLASTRPPMPSTEQLLENCQ